MKLEARAEQIGEILVDPDAIKSNDMKGSTMAKVEKKRDSSSHAIRSATFAGTLFFACTPSGASPSPSHDEVPAESTASLGPGSSVSMPMSSTASPRRGSVVDPVGNHRAAVRAPRVESVPKTPLAVFGAGVAITPATGHWQFGASNPADTFAVLLPFDHCPAGSAYVFMMTIAAGQEPDSFNIGSTIAHFIVLGSDLAVPQRVEGGSFAKGDIQNMLGRMLPPGTTTGQLSAEDAAKPVGTVIARATFSITALCTDTDFNTTALYAAPIEISGATRPPKPTDWPDDTFYDPFQWSWSAKSFGSGG